MSPILSVDLEGEALLVVDESRYLCIDKCRWDIILASGDGIMVGSMLVFVLPCDIYFNRDLSEMHFKLTIV